MGLFGKKKNDPNSKKFRWEMARAVEAAPTIDAVPVVRCKECKFFSMTTLGMPFGACWHRADEINGLSGEDNGYTVCHRVDSPDFFCAWGERREDGHTER